MSCTDWAPRRAICSAVITEIDCGVSATGVSVFSPADWRTCTAVTVSSDSAAPASPPTVATASASAAQAGPATQRAVAASSPRRPPRRPDPQTILAPISCICDTFAFICGYSVSMGVANRNDIETHYRNGARKDGLAASPP
jgi:hypothetical protein